MPTKGTPGAEDEDGFRFRRRTRAATRSQSMPAAASAPLLPGRNMGKTRKRKHSTAEKPASVARAATPKKKALRTEKKKSPGADRKPFAPVDPNAPVPPGQRLKRSVRLEKRKAELTEEQKREFVLAESRVRCSKLFRQVDPNLSEVEQLRQLVQKLLDTEHVRSMAGEDVSDADFAAAAASALEVLDSDAAKSIGLLQRPNSENKRLAQREWSLQVVIQNYNREKEVWERISRDIEQMESQKASLPPPRDVGDSTDDVEIAAIADTSKTAVEDYVQQTSRLKSIVGKMERNVREVDAKALKMLEVFEKRLARDIKSIKTPKKPETFPKGGELVADF